MTHSTNVASHANPTTHESTRKYKVEATGMRLLEIYSACVFLHAYQRREYIQNSRKNSLRKYVVEIAT